MLYILFPFAENRLRKKMVNLMMDKFDKAKDELLQELNALKQENAALKDMREKDIRERNRAENEIASSGIKSGTFFNSTGKAMPLNDEQNIRQLFDDYLRMYSSRDDKLTTYFSDNFSGFTGGGDFLVKDREEWVAITRQDFAQVKDPLRIELKDIAVQSLADTIAVATGFFTIHLPIKDHVLSRETARLVLIFRKEQAGWKISHSSISIPYYLVREGEVYPMKELADRNQILEELIAERTIQLSEANDNLQHINEKLARDITERKLAEEALRQSNQKLEAIISATPDGIGMISLDGKMQFVSDKLAEMNGYTMEEIDKFIGKHVSDFIDPSSHKMLIDNIRKLLAGESDNKLTEYLAIKKDNSRFYIDVNSTVLFDSAGNPASILFVERDITERKHAELIIQQQNNQLQELNSAKDKFFSIIAHDLRSPFQSLLSSSELLATEIESLSSDEIKLSSVGLNSSLKNLYGLLENLLQWSMMQRDMLEYKPVNLNLYDIVNKIIEISNQSAMKKKISVSNNVDPGAFVYADVNMLRSVIQNLITNAIKFTPREGRVIVSSTVKDGFVEVSIQDTGIGIKPEKSSKLFNFNTIFTTNGTDGEKGTGLGLPLCKEFIEMHGGKIWVESESGKGSKFKFTLHTE